MKVAVSPPGGPIIDMVQAARDLVPCINPLDIDGSVVSVGAIGMIPSSAACTPTTDSAG